MKRSRLSSMLLRLVSGFFLSGLLIVIPPATSAEEIVVIANEAFPANSMTLLNLAHIYNGYSVLMGGSRLQPLDQADDQRIKVIFLDKVVHFTPAAYKDYWVKWAFAVGRHAPLVMSDSKEVIRTVQKQEGSLGYVWAHEIQGIGGLKVLLRIPVSE